MKSQETLEKAIKKAEKNHWNFFDWTEADDFEWSMTTDEFDQPLLQINGLGDEFYFHPNLVIYNHDFAKALWGDGLVNGKVPFNVSLGLERPGNTVAWEYHLQMMVIADDPIWYLGNNLPE